MGSRKGISTITIFILFILVIAAGGFSYTRVINSPNMEQQTSPITPSSDQEEKTPQNTTASDTIDSARWKTHRNNTYGFQFNYPDDWHLDIPEEVGYFTVQVKNELTIDTIAQFEVWVHRTQFDITQFNLSSGQKFADQLTNRFNDHGAILFDFDNCLGEGSGVACVSKVIKIPIGSDEDRFTVGDRVYIDVDVIEMRYGVYRHNAFSGIDLENVTDRSAENINTLLGLDETYRSIEPVMDHILTTFVLSS